MNKYRKLLAALMIVPLLGVAWSIISTPKAFAAANFNYTDHLMDDDVFRATSTMSASDIQNFLTAKGSGLAPFFDVENCGSTSGAHYSYYATYYHCGQTMSAAQIIYDAAHAYGINPQVILATMQKEESLITTPNPTSSQLNYAMGYGCPDSGGCGYAGFFNQVDNGAWQFRTDMELGSGNNWWGYTPSSYPCNGATRYYSAALKAGSNVTFYDVYGNAYIAFTMPNMSTATLYCYTPHVYPGSGAEYYSGSYWFVYYFSRWFVSYSWKLTGQYAHKSDTDTTNVNLANLLPGDRVYVGFTAQNTGNVTWSKTGANPVTVGTVSPLERSSSFSAGSNWLSGTRPAALKESSVAPGATGTFEFWMTAPSFTGGPRDYNERFGLVANGAAWFNDVGLSYYAKVTPYTYTWRMVSQYAYTDAGKTTVANMNSVLPGQKIYVGFTAQNKGTATWTNSGSNPVMAGTANPLDRLSSFAPGSTWLSGSRPVLLSADTAAVAPEGIGKFEFWLTAPNTPGVYNERFSLIANNLTWFNDVGLSYYVKVVPKIYSWGFIGQYAYTDSNRTIVANMANMQAGDKVYVRFTAQNTGNVTWSNTGPNPIMVGTAYPFDRVSSFGPGSGWLSGSRPAVMKDASLAPGATGTFEFTMTAPNTLGEYNERFSLMANNLTWLNDPGLSFYAKVNP